MAGYLTNKLGDIYARQTEEGGTESIDPDRLGWARPLNLPPADRRMSIQDVKDLPGFSVTEEDGIRRLPGPKPKHKPRTGYVDGASPPALLRNERELSAYYDRLSDALGSAVQRLLSSPESPPVIVDDFVGGRRFTVHYRPILEPGGPGSVYVVTDGHAYKIGHANVPVERRIRGLQTGNPREIRTVAIIRQAPLTIERVLHKRFAQHALKGEWFSLEGLEALVEQSSGWRELLLSSLPEGPWEIDISPS
jgi:hypothetical protein